MNSADNFISYDVDLLVKQEKITDPDFPLESPHSGETDSTSLFPNNLHHFGNQYYPSNNEPQYDGYQGFNEEDFAKPAPFQIIRTKKEELSEEESIQVKVEYDDKVSAKTKRILKREKAKQRAKNKQEKPPIPTIQTPVKNVNEIIEDSQLDDKTKKKMVQMIRNRISAQNSRDRKKAYLSQLENIKEHLAEENKKMNQENSHLLEEIKKLEEAHARAVQENEELKKSLNFVCNFCGRSQNQSPENDQTEDNFNETFSLPSPNLTRLNSYGNKSLFQFTFALATILACIIINGNSPQGTTGTVANIQNNINNIGNGQRLLQEDNEKIVSELEEKVSQPCTQISTDEFDIQSKGPLIVKNIAPLRKEFEEQHLNYFKKDVHSKFVLNSDDIKVEEYDSDHAIVNFRATPSFGNNFLSKNNNEENSKNLPVLSSQNNYDYKSSTLFCPSGYQIVDEDKNQQFDEENKESSSLAQTQYLQLVVPKSSLSRFNLGNLSHDIPNSISNSDDDSSLMELWCKVFYVRELSSEL